MIGNRLHRIAMLNICAMDCLIPLRFRCTLRQQQWNGVSGMGSGLELSVIFFCLNNIANRLVMDSQMIGNRLHCIAMLNICSMDYLSPLQFRCTLRQQ